MKRVPQIGAAFRPISIRANVPIEARSPNNAAFGSTERRQRLKTIPKPPMTSAKLAQRQTCCSKIVLLFGTGVA